MNKGFNPICVCVNPQSALRTLATKFENMVFDLRREGDYVSTVDAKIRRIKERYRSV